MREIVLTKGKVAIVDDEDYEWINELNWFFSDGYAVRNERRYKGRGGQRQVGMHRYLGRFALQEDAAKAYKQAAIRYHGEFARW